MAQMMNLIFILAVLVAFESLPRALRTIVQKSELEQLRREVAVTGIQPNMAKSPGPASVTTLFPLLENIFFQQASLFFSLNKSSDN